MIASVIKLFKVLAEVSRKVERGLTLLIWMEEGLGEVHPRHDKLAFFSFCECWRHQTLNGTCPGPHEGREGDAMSKKGWRKEIE